MGCRGSKAVSPRRPPVGKNASQAEAQHKGKEEEETPQEIFSTDAAGAGKAELAGGVRQQGTPAEERADKDEEEEDPLKGIDLSIPEDCEEVAMKNGVTYRGEWRNGKQHGRGEQRQPQGVVYTGQFVQGQIEGFGRLTRPDGSKYEGEFVRGKAETRTRPGVYTFPDGSK